MLPDKRMLCVCKSCICYQTGACYVCVRFVYVTRQVHVMCVRFVYVTKQAYVGCVRSVSVNRHMSVGCVRFVCASKPDTCLLGVRHCCMSHV